MPPKKKNKAKDLQNTQADAILLTGDATLRRKIKNALRDLQPPILSSAWSGSLFDEIENPLSAIVIATPILGLPLPTALRSIRQRKQLASVPVFAVVDSGLANETAKELYTRGVSAVIGWPHEARVFPRVLVEAMAINQVRGTAKSSDKAIERLIQTHLKLLPADASDVSVSVCNGIVHLTGSIRTMWLRQETIHATQNVMGVRSVIAKDLIVARSVRTDREVLHSVRNVLKATQGTDLNTLSPTVRNGFVTLAGTVENKKELARIEDVLIQVSGVRGIEKLTTLSSHAKTNHRAVAKRLERLLAETHPEDEVEVSFFAGVAVLSGRARSLRERRAIVAAVEGDDAVTRVVDKIDV